MADPTCITQAILTSAICANLSYDPWTARLLPLLVLLTFGAQAPAPVQKLPLEQIKLPPGFSIELYATGVDNARQMALGDKGTLFVGSRTAGKVYAVVDRDGDKKADQVHTIASGLSSPSGIAFRDGALRGSGLTRASLRRDRARGAARAGGRERHAPQ